MEHINYPLQRRRFKTRAVQIEGAPMGGDNPIRIQSMLSSPVDKTEDCLREIRSLDCAGCELIRLTIPSVKALEAVPEIKRRMKEEGVSRPLIADIHFSRQLAIEACELFEKVRINPGNYSDTPKNSGNFTDGRCFEEGREKLKEAVAPLAESLKKYGRALRIGVNQGSLSRRMVERYGDTPLGMVSSAMELIELFEERQTRKLVVSLKSSNPGVVQKAYRLLMEKYPDGNAPAIHLGVTESGSGLMGRIKSLAGIGPLLADGIGDTVRVSLTEEAVNEVAFARKMLKALGLQGESAKSETKVSHFSKDDFYSRPLDHQRTNNAALKLANLEIGGSSALKIGRIDGSVLPEHDIDFDIDFNCWLKGGELFFEDCGKPIRFVSDADLNASEADGARYSALLVRAERPLLFLRRYYKKLSDRQGPLPMGMIYPAGGDSEENVRQNVEMAAILGEGLIDYLVMPPEMNGGRLTEMLLLLQASRSRIFIADYIVCPSCGRTQFDIQAAAEEIKRLTSHLKGIKIGVMGCVVNGPGEMADADFGYVGSGADKVDLYCGRQRVSRGISAEKAVPELIRLIKKKGEWRPPPDQGR